MKKIKTKFYLAATKLVNAGGTEEDVYELTKEFEITTDEVKSWLSNTAKSRAFSATLFASKAEKATLYNILDEKFIIEYPQIVLFRREENSSFYEYKNGVYVFVFDQDIYNLVDELMKKFSLLEDRSSSRHVKDTVTRISSLLSRTPERNFTEEALLNQKFFLNLKNGLLDMETFEIKPHIATYFSTVQVPYEYNPEAKCQKFDDFIKKITKEDKSNAFMIQQMFGYSIGEGNPMHKVFFLYGDTARNGKSTTAKILCGLIGWGNVSTLSLHQIEGENSSILTALVGKQLNFSDEISSKFIESSRLTAMSSEGVIDINPKYKNSFRYSVKAKFIIACNDLPRFNDFQGMKHRMISIPFRYQLKEKERILRYEDILLKEEGSGILNWAIEGAKTLKDGFIISEASKEDLKDNIHQSNSTYAFIDSEYDLDSTFTEAIESKELYGKAGISPTGYIKFCYEQGIKTCSLLKFQFELKRHSGEYKILQPKRIGHRAVRGYTGLKLKSDVDNEKNMTF